MSDEKQRSRRRWAKGLRREADGAGEDLLNGLPVPDFIRPLWEELGRPKQMGLPEMVQPLLEEAAGVLEAVIAEEEEERRKKRGEKSEVGRRKDEGGNGELGD